MSKSSYKTAQLEAYQLNIVHTLSNERFKRLTERLYAATFDCVDSVVTQSLLADHHSCAAIIIGLQHPYLVDYKGSTVV